VASRRSGRPVAVAVGPHRRPRPAGEPRQRRLGEAVAAVLEQHHLVRPAQADVRFAVVIKVDRGDRLGLGVELVERRVPVEARHALQPADVLAAPPDEVALRVVVELLEAGLHPLDAGRPLVDRLLVAVHHARDDHLLAVQDLGDEPGELLDLAGVAPQHERLAVRHAPPLPLRVRLVPRRAEVRLAGPAVVEEDGRLADLRPPHDLLPLARAQPAAADVVLDLGLRVLAFHVLNLGIDDEVLLAVHLRHLHDDDVGGLADDVGEGDGHLDVGLRLRRGPQDGDRGERAGEQQAAEERAVSHGGTLIALGGVTRRHRNSNASAQATTMTALRMPKPANRMLV
jgi:hypothetical protein